MCTSVAIIEKGRLLSVGTLGEISRQAAPGTHLLLRAFGMSAAELCRALLETPGVERAVEQGPFAAATIAGGDEGASRIVSSLVGRGVPLLECRVEAANLEDVFMNVTHGDIA